MVASGGSALLFIQAGESGRFGILAGWALLYVTLARGVSWVEWQQREGTRGEI
jgi:hypothetical protein